MLRKLRTLLATASVINSPGDWRRCYDATDEEVFRYLVPRYPPFPVVSLADVLDYQWIFTREWAARMCKSRWATYEPILTRHARLVHLVPAATSHYCERGGLLRLAIDVALATIRRLNIARGNASEAETLAAVVVALCKTADLLNDWRVTDTSERITWPRESSIGDWCISNNMREYVCTPNNYSMDSGDPCALIDRIVAGTAAMDCLEDSSMLDEVAAALSPDGEFTRLGALFEEALRECARQDCERRQANRLLFPQSALQAAGLLDDPFVACVLGTRRVE